MSTHTVLPSAPGTKGGSGRERAASAAAYSNSRPILYQYFEILFQAFGPQNWWPGRTRFEVILGAILTQNTSWRNVERAIRVLRHKRLLNPAGIRRTPIDTLAAYIHSTGYFRAKARKLKEFLTYLNTRHNGSLNQMFRTPTMELREQLLGVYGIGPETADSILLYAGEHAVFVVDAYTRRILERHELVPKKKSYEDLRGLLEKSLPRDALLFNEFHALIVHVGKNFCRPKAPNCSACPLGRYLPTPIEGAR